MNTWPKCIKCGGVVTHPNWQTCSQGRFDICKQPPKQADKDKRVKICDRLFEAHNSINRAISYGVGKIMIGDQRYPIQEELAATFEQCEAIILQAKIDCERMRKE